MGTNHLKNPKRKIEKMKIYYASEIAEDVMERLDGQEDFESPDIMLRENIFKVKTLKFILKDKETNEDTKCLIKELLEDCKGVNYFMIVY